MQIKERGYKLALIRSEYVPEKKRTVGRFVGSFDKWKDDIPDDVRPKLTDEEAEQVRDELCRRSKERDANSGKLALMLLPKTLDKVADQIEDGEGNEPAEPSDDHVQDIYSGIDRLQKVLRSRGFKRVKAPKGQKGQDKSQDAGDNQNNLI